jgi:hypothetical protein
VHTRARLAAWRASSLHALVRFVAFVASRIRNSRLIRSAGPAIRAIFSTVSNRILKPVSSTLRDRVAGPILRSVTPPVTRVTRAAALRVAQSSLAQSRVAQIWVARSRVAQSRAAQSRFGQSRVAQSRLAQPRIALPVALVTGTAVAVIAALVASSGPATSTVSASGPSAAHVTAPAGAHRADAVRATTGTTPGTSAPASKAPAKPAAPASKAPASKAPAKPAAPAKAAHPAVTHPASHPAASHPAHPAASHAAARPVHHAVRHHTAPSTWRGITEALAGHPRGGALSPAQKLLPAGMSGHQAFLPITPARAANAKLITAEALRLHMGIRSAVIAVATAIQESTLENLTYGDRDSLGLFQQRPSAGWGTPAEITNPTYAADAFLHALADYQRNDPNWARQPLWEAAQGVQRSAFPTAYAQWEDQAAHIVASSAHGLLSPSSAG